MRLMMVARFTEPIYNLIGLRCDEPPITKPFESLFLRAEVR